MLIKPLESIYMSVQAERSMTALIEKYSVEKKIKCLINTRDVALLGFMNNCYGVDNSSIIWLIAHYDSLFASNLCSKYTTLYNLHIDELSLSEAGSRYFSGSVIDVLIIDLKNSANMLMHYTFRSTAIRELIVLDTESNRIFIENTFIPRLVTYNSGINKITYIKE